MEWEVALMKMGLPEANQNFSKAIKAVKSGKVVILTERGKPIARIQPIPKANTDEETMQQLIAEGLIIPAKHPGPIWSDDWAPLDVPGVSFSKVLREMRNED